MVVGFSTTYAISAYHHKREFEPRSWRDVLDITLCDEVCQWLATGWWISPGTPVNWPPRYSWNIVESGVKHHKPNQPKQIHNSPVGLKGKWVHCAHKKTQLTTALTSDSLIGWLWMTRCKLIRSASYPPTLPFPVAIKTPTHNHNFRLFDYVNVNLFRS